MNKEFKPTATDIVSFIRVISKRTDRSIITRDDVEKVVFRYFGNTSIHSETPT